MRRRIPPPSHGHSDMPRYETAPAHLACRMPSEFLACSVRYRGIGIVCQRGVGLIEVMVAVLVLSIGFLGLGALLATSLSTNNSAMGRSMATIATYSVLDAMRADLVNARNGAYNTPAGKPLKANACPSGSGTLANVQLARWCQQLGSITGPAATTTGAIACTATGQCVITIGFDDSRAGVGGSSNQQIVTRAVL